MRSIFARHAVSKVVFNDNGPQYSSHDFKKYYGASYTRLSVLSSQKVMAFWRELFKRSTKPYENTERITGSILSHASATHSQKQLWHIHLRVANEKKVAGTSTFTKPKRKHQNKTQ